ncbi:AAA family ATPase [Aeromonas veronii]|uniref:AAA family ATPase n=1 Tax=Aeromonas veronii TaxID=654 RepID=UPI0030062308
MQIESVYIENIKRFGKGGFLLKLKSDLEHKIATVSGVNGSGKTAAFKAIQLFQKLFFHQQLDENRKQKIHEKIVSSIDQLIVTDEAKIDIHFKIDNETYGISLSISLCKDELDYVFTPNEATPNAIEAVSQFWKIERPRSLVVFIDAGKSFSDFGINFDHISLKSRAEHDEDFFFDCIFYPEETLQAIYRRTVLDHIQYRLDPSRVYPYFQAANEAIKRISGNIEVKNVSATKKDGQLIIQGKTSENVSLYDVKDFSSGERAIYLTILFLFFFPSVGTLIIDEPENHFHESLLSNFYLFLREVTECGGINEWTLKNIKTDKKHKHFQNQDSDSLNRIFLITHSKPLIYQNINFGDCFMLGKDGLNKVYNYSLESELRNAGISSVFSRTLFVEGESDRDIFLPILSLHRINVVSVSDCKEVVEQFSKIARIKNLIHGASFCFAMDRDNKSAQDIDEIRNISPDFYDESFIVLERHEIENYMIDIELVMDAINPTLDTLHEEKITTAEIEAIFSKEADSLKEQSYYKFASFHLKQYIKENIGDNIGNVKKMKGGIDELINASLHKNITQNVIEYNRDIKIKFDSEWHDNWKCLIDGKAFIAKAMSGISKRCVGIKPEKIKSNMLIRLQEEPEKYVLGRLIDEVINKFKHQDNIGI